ncbi:MAG TPA: hypothetical protein VGE37_04615, partial [Archangium sp.]
MSWDEALFSVAWDGARRWLSPEVNPERVDATPERERLEVLARLLSGAPMTVTLTEDVGGVRGDVLFLPKYVDLAGDSLNRAALLVRVVWGCATRALRLTRPARGDVLLATALAVP